MSLHLWSCLTSLSVLHISNNIPCLSQCPLISDHALQILTMSLHFLLYSSIFDLDVNFWPSLNPPLMFTLRFLIVPLLPLRASASLTVFPLSLIVFPIWLCTCLSLCNNVFRVFTQENFLGLPLFIQVTLKIFITHNQIWAWTPPHGGDGCAPQWLPCTLHVL